MYRAAAAFTGLILLAAPASAETVERTVKANTITAVGGFLSYEVDTCYPAEIPNVKVRQEPGNGAVRIVPHEQVLGKDSRCPGTKVRGVAYVYTPKKGFKGDDTFTLEVPWHSTDSGPGSTLSYTYRIHVE